MILLVPVLQACMQCCWMLLWAFCASFLLSQVPEDYVGTQAFRTYAEAYGTEDTPGECTGTWPTGSVWKDVLNCDTVNGEPACWRCSPPRFMTDVRFFVSFFVFLWNNALQIALGQLIVAMSCTLWFFTPNADKGSRGGVCGAVGTIMRYHAGSAMFGSLIIAIVQFVRFLMYYLEKNAQAQKNGVMVIVLKAVQCCLWCFEKCLKFLNKNAYIQIAIKSTNFCTSAKNAFMIIVQNALRFGAIAALGSGIAWLGFFFITASTVSLGYLYLTAMHNDTSLTVPVILYYVLGHVASSMFMAVFGMSVSTILQCFIHCESEKLDGDFVPAGMTSWLHLEDKKDTEQSRHEPAKE